MLGPGALRNVTLLGAVAQVDAFSCGVDSSALFQNPLATFIDETVMKEKATAENLPTTQARVIAVRKKQTIAEALANG